MVQMVSPQACLACGHVVDRQGQLSCDDDDDEYAMPAPGDCTLCIRCGYVMVFDHTLRFRRPTPEEKREFDNDHRVQAAIAVIHKMKN